MKIISTKFYSLLEVQKLTGIKSRQYLSQYIKDGLLTAIEVGGKEEGKRYAIKGEWVQSFIERYNQGLIKGEKYTIAELKKTLAIALDYCQKNNIQTIEEFIKSIENIK